MKAIFHLLMSGDLLAISMFDFAVHLVVRYNRLSGTKIVIVWQNILIHKIIYLLQACTYVQVGKNQVPNFPHAFVCCWDDCERTFNNSQMFLHHVQTHVYHNPHGHKVAGGIPCGWHGEF